MNEASTLTYTNNNDLNSATNSIPPKSTKKSTRNSGSTSNFCCFGSKSSSSDSYVPNTSKNTSNLESYAALVENG